MLGVGNPFSEKMFKKLGFLHGMGATWNLKADEPDEPDEADEGKMVHGRQFGP